MGSILSCWASTRPGRPSIRDQAAVLDVLAAIGTIALLLVAMCARPLEGQCPRGFYVDGVRPSGVYGCIPAPPREPDARGHEPDPPPRNDPEVESRIYCTGGTIPIVCNDRVVGCQAR